jgi:hypothetical protein
MDVTRFIQTNNPGMVIMDYISDTPNLRKGRFLWMDAPEREQFLSMLKHRIADGYYYTDSIFAKIADELAPVMVEAVEE